MNLLCKAITATAIALTMGVTYASPKRLMTHNKTNVESNAYIAGTIPSVHPSKPNSDNPVSWAEVRIACYGHITNNKCSALIKMETNTPHPIDIGTAVVDLESGVITFSYINESTCPYVLTVNGVAEVTVTRR
jgi:hypothetical protein